MSLDKVFWPTVYVFLVPTADLLDLRTADPNPSHDGRAHRQKSAVMSYASVFSPFLGASPLIVSYSPSVTPCLVIKLSPQFDWRNALGVTHEYLLPGPDKDRTYSALLKYSVPRLAVYEE